MTDIAYETSDLLVVDLLSIACSDPSPVEGYSTYRVETHCTAVTYTAKVIDRDHNGAPTRYAVLDAVHAQH